MRRKTAASPPAKPPGTFDCELWLTIFGDDGRADIARDVVLPFVPHAGMWWYDKTLPLGLEGWDVERVTWIEAENRFWVDLGNWGDKDTQYDCGLATMLDIEFRDWKVHAMYAKDGKELPVPTDRQRDTTRAPGRDAVPPAWLRD